MKRKKISALLALVLGLTAFGGCTNANQKVNFANLWYLNPIVNETLHETLVYDVTFKGNDNTLVDYDLDYKDGKYTTVLTNAVENDVIVYTYTTHLSITAMYTLNGVTEECVDTVTSTVKFYAAGYNLQPISSEKEINASTPTVNTGTKVSDSYQKSHYSTKVVYNDDCTEGTSTVTYYPDNGTEAQTQEKTFEIEQKKLTYLDNEQVILALRAIRNTTTSAKLNVYSPFAEAVQKLSYSFDSDASAEFSFLKNGENTKSMITYRTAKLVLDEKNPGATQTAWIAKQPENTSASNTNRNVILRLETPLSYGLGTLIYTLNSASYQ